MKKLLSIIILFIVIPFATYSQEKEEKDDNFHFIDAGTGVSYTREVHGVLNVALTNSIGTFMANFIDYNLAFGKSDVLFHEFNFKIGPYYQFNRYSYIAVSSGVSLIWNSGPVVDSEYDNFYRYYTTTYSEDEFLLNIPIQAKLNIGVYKGYCIGFKGTYNKMIEKSVEDKWTVLMYLAVGF